MSEIPWKGVNTSLTVNNKVNCLPFIGVSQRFTKMFVPFDIAHLGKLMFFVKTETNPI